VSTKAETRDRVANDLGLLRLGQSLQYQDQARIESGYDEVHADLKTEGLATWPLAGEVPTNLVPHVVALVVLNCADTYGVSQERMQRILLKATTAKREINKIISPDYESLEDPTDY